MAIGIILDVKLYNLAPAKESLLNSIGNIPVGEDLFYLYHPNATTPFEKKGEKIQCIYYYNKIEINPNIALTQTTYILGSERDEEYRRKVIFITDHYDEMYNEQLNIIFKINQVQRFDCKYFFIGIGHQNFEFVGDIKIITLDSPEEIQKTLNTIFSKEEHSGKKTNDERESSTNNKKNEITIQQNSIIEPKN